MSIKVPTLDKLYSLKEKIFIRLKIDYPTKFLLSKGLTPNKITIFGIFIGFLSIFYLFNNPIIFSFLYLFNRFLDILDGYVARRFNLKTKLGDRLDHWGDLVIHIGLLLNTIIFSNLGLIATIALFAYVGEYVLLKKQNALHKKFPSGVFALFFVLGLYKLGLIYQIIYQVISYIYFQLNRGKQ